MPNQKGRNLPVSYLNLATLLGWLFLCLTNANANDDSFYLNVSGGYAEHQFDVAEHTAAETSASTFTMSIGWDLSDRVTLEHHWYRLGSYRFNANNPDSEFSASPTADVNGLGVAGLFYLIGSRGPMGLSQRRGFSVYSKLAITLIGGDLWFGNLEVFADEIDGWHPGLGLGLEYAHPTSNFAIRSGIEALGSELYFGSVSLLWRWGRH